MICLGCFRKPYSLPSSLAVESRRPPDPARKAVTIVLCRVLRFALSRCIPSAPSVVACPVVRSLEIRGEREFLISDRINILG
jgi:hypothetical protein